MVYRLRNCLRALVAAAILCLASTTSRLTEEPEDLVTEPSLLHGAEFGFSVTLRPNGEPVDLHIAVHPPDHSIDVALEFCAAHKLLGREENEWPSECLGEEPCPDGGLRFEQHLGSPCVNMLSQKIDSLRKLHGGPERARWSRPSGAEHWVCPPLDDDQYAYMEHYSSRALITRSGRHAIIHEHRRLGGKRFLMIGSGLDSAQLCAAVAAEGGTAFFVEALGEWMDLLVASLASAVAGLPGTCHAVRQEFTSHLREWRADIERRDPDFLMPAGLHEAVGDGFDTVVVDGPEAHSDSTPGRMQSIWAASVLVRPGGSVFIDDFDREPERAAAWSFLQGRSGDLVYGGVRLALFQCSAPPR